MRRLAVARRRRRRQVRRRRGWMERRMRVRRRARRPANAFPHRTAVRSSDRGKGMRRGRKSDSRHRDTASYFIQP
eukprot:scaffold120768_cov51-Phaeocystis_antarctica.AAC.1